MTSSPSRRAVELFLRELASASDLAADLERVCAANPELSADLRALAADWGRVESALGSLGLLHFLPRKAQHTPKARADGGEPPSSAAERRAEKLLSTLAQGSPTHRYEIRSEVARGGQGLVYRVWDASLRRELAMKVLLERHHGDKDKEETSRSLLRFLEEAHVNGQLDHPGVVPVHELGLDHEGRAYFTMKLVRGQTLAEVFDLASTGEGGWNPTRVASVLLKVCEAMSYAHAKGVIHRDLKPGNVMVGRFGEVYVMDWGLARVLGEVDTQDIRIDTSASRVPGLESASGSPDSENDELRTMEGRVIGTPAYMPPEQARGEIERVNARSDVYSLGAMLYQLLTGKPPYWEGEARPHALAVLQRCMTEPPPPVHALAPTAPRELEAIAERAMARDPALRYPSMEALAEDLRAYLEGRVVSAYESGQLAAMRKWVRRNRGLAAASLAALLLLVGGLAVSLVLGSEAAQQRSNVMRLSAFRRMDDLGARAETLWPVLPARIPDYERWLSEARALIGELDETQAGPGHRALLAKLRERGTVLTGAELEAAERGDPRYPELLAKRAELAALEHADAVRRGQKAEHGVLSMEMRALPAFELNDLAWSRVRPERTLFGHEVEALAMVELALEKANPQDDRALLEDTHARACFVNGLDDEAMQAAQTAAELAPAAQKPAYEARVERLEGDIAEARSSAVAPRRELLARRERATQDAIDADVAWIFPDEESAWWHGQLARLVRELEGWMDPETGLVSGASSTGWGIERRLAMAQHIQERTLASEEARTLWAEAGAALAADPRFGGLALAPQPGLLPLGPDPRSGLWEFALLASGEIPRRRANGMLVVDEESALVLVLLPGGTFVMGAQGQSPSKPDYDPDARLDEGPPGPVELAPYFCSKFELTQSQWKRLTGASPSVYRKGVSWGGVAVQGTHPVENVSWEECVRALSWIDLVLPTEAQWECAARAGTSTPWSTGAERESLAGCANLADRAADRMGSAWPAILDWPELDDGFAAHAPVGSFLPNAFGLHDVHGNVAEWCRDVHRERSYTWPARRGDGLRAGVEGPSSTARGGSFVESAAVARSAYRMPFGREAREPYVGLRPVRELRP